MQRDNGLRRSKKDRWMFIITIIIGMILCLSGASMMFFGIGPLPVRITLGILGIVLISTSRPIAKALIK